ncbi:MAG: ABC transporter ATP-binding protein [Christensenella sp.]
MSMFKLFRRYLGQYKVQVILVFAFVITQAICQLFLPKLMSNIVDKGVTTGNTQYILTQGLLMLGVSIISLITVAGSANFSALVTAKFSSFVRRDMFSKTLKFSQGDFEKFGVATLLNRSNYDAVQMQTVVINSLRALILVPITGVGALVFAFVINIQLTLVVLAAFSLTLFFMARAIKNSQPLYQKVQVFTDKINMLINEKLKGMRSIRAFNRQDYEQNKFAKANAQQTDQFVRANLSINYLAPAIQIVLGLTTVIILWIGTNQIAAQQIMIGNLMQFIQYISLFMMTITSVMILFSALPRVEVSASRVLELLDAEVTMHSIKNPSSLEDEKAKITFDDVSFGYPGAQKSVLKNISFCAEQGKTTAIVGATGSGKSTLLSLILRMNDCSSGSIKFGEVSVANCALKELRSAISFVPQKSALFAESIRDNMKIANKNATDEEILNAIEIAGAKEFVDKKGLDEVLAQEGKSLSGGQKQRLCIARALLKKASIYMFDDCFSALDYKTDFEVRTAINQNFEGSTRIIVAQRISTIKSADHIIVLDEGEIAGQGTHDQLLKSCQIYKDIIRSQTGGDA